jgi:hypothetical protein
VGDGVSEVGAVGTPLGEALLVPTTRSAEGEAVPEGAEEREAGALTLPLPPAEGEGACDAEPRTVREGGCGDAEARGEGEGGSEALSEREGAGEGESVGA